MLLGLGALYQGILIILFSVEVPWRDEWEYFVPQGLDKVVHWDWMYGFHNEHRHLLPKLWTWVIFKFTHLNIQLHLVLNYLFYLFIVYLLVSLKNKTFGRNKFKLFPIFMIPLFCTKPWSNHMAIWQSGFHFLILGQLLFVFLYSGLFSMRSSFRLLGGIFSIGIMIYSVAAGLGISGAMVISVMIMEGIFKRRIAFESWVLLCIWGLMSWSYLLGMPKTSIWAYPWQWEFWHFFLQELGHSLGAVSHHRAIPLGVLLALLLIVGLRQWLK